MRAVLLAGLTTFAFGIMYQVSWRMVAVSAVIGGMAWAVYEIVAGHFGGTDGWAEFAGAFMVGALAQVAASRWKQPAIVFQVPAMIPFVPGYLMYESMLAFMRNQFQAGLRQALQALLLAAALSVGLAVASAAVRPLLNKEQQSRRLTRP